MTRDDLREFLHAQLDAADTDDYVAKSYQMAREIDASPKAVGRAIQELRADDSCDLDFRKWGGEDSAWIVSRDSD